MNKFEVRLDKKYDYQSITIWGNNLASALTEALLDQQEPGRLGFTEDDVLSVWAYRKHKKTQ